MKTKVTIFMVLFITSSAFCSIDFEEVTFGYNNGFKSEKWVPLNVTIRSQNEPIPFNGELIVEVRNYNSNTPIYRYATPLQLSKTDRKQKHIYIYHPKSTVRLVIKLERKDISDQDIQISITEPRAIHEITPPIPIANKDYLVLVLAPNGDKLKKNINNKQLDDDGTHVHIKYVPNTRAMPTRWVGYDAVDLVIIRGVSLTDKRILKQQQTALLDWVQRGGTLILSGGSNFRLMKDSFIEQFLPVKLVREETLDMVPPTLGKQFGLTIENNDSVITTSNTENIPFKNIHFEPKQGCQTLLGTDDQIFIAKRNFGSGQIICLAFDYNAPSFSNLKAGETFWRWLLKTNGKSPKLFADKYAPFRQHDEKINKHFLSKMPTQVPLIKLLAIVLPLHLISWGGITFYVGRRGCSQQKRMRGYWLGGLIMVFVSVSAIGFARVVLPKNIGLDMFSILTIYPERKNAHYQTYVSLRSFAFTKTSIDSYQDNFVRPLLNEGRTHPAKFFQQPSFYLQDVAVGPWAPSTYVYDIYFTVDVQQGEITLENAWIIKGEKALKLGTITIGKNNILPQEPLNEQVKKIPPDEELDGNRKTFARILQQEGLFLYLSNPENLLNTDEVQTRTVLIGWHPTATPITWSNRNDAGDSETLVIMYLNEEDTGM